MDLFDFFNVVKFDKVTTVMVSRQEVSETNLEYNIYLYQNNGMLHIKTSYQIHRQGSKSGVARCFQLKTCL